MICPKQRINIGPGHSIMGCALWEILNSGCTKTHSVRFKARLAENLMSVNIWVVFNLQLLSSRSCDWGKSGWRSGHQSRLPPLWSPGIESWASHVGWDLSISIWLRGFFSGYYLSRSYLVVCKFALSRQHPSRRANKTLASG